MPQSGNDDPMGFDNAGHKGPTFCGRPQETIFPVCPIKTHRKCRHPLWVTTASSEKHRALAAEAAHNLLERERFSLNAWRPFDPGSAAQVIREVFAGYNFKLVVIPDMFSEILTLAFGIYELVIHGGRNLLVDIRLTRLESHNQQRSQWVMPYRLDVGRGLDLIQHFPHPSSQASIQTPRSLEVKSG